MRAFKHMVGGIADHASGVDLVKMVQQAGVVAAGAAHCQCRMIGPLAAQNRAVFGKEICGRYGRGQEDIVVEVQEML